MKILTKEEVLNERKRIVEEIKEGKVFIYPTDTIYGIGCNALNSEGVLKIRELKKRESKPFSIIAPDKKWIEENCFVNENVKEWLDKLPGAYTLILNLKNKKGICSETNNGMESIGVRMINSWFQELVKEAGVPFVTTSVNLSGGLPISSLDECREEIKQGVDYFIDVGKIAGSPSTIVNLTEKKEEIIRR